MASKDVAMRCAGIAFLLLLSSPIYINAGPGDDTADQRTGPSSITLQNVQSPLLASPTGSNVSSLFTTILPLADSADSLEPAGAPAMPPSNAVAPSSQIVAAP